MRSTTRYVLLAMLAGSIPMGAEAVRAEKAAICHYNADLDPGAPTWERLEIGGGAKTLQAHLDHGDAPPSTLVPGTARTFIFDEACAPAPADVCVYQQQLRDQGIDVRMVALTLRLGPALSTDFTQDQNGKLVVGPILDPSYREPDVFVRISNSSDPHATGEAYFAGIVRFGGELTGAVAAAGRLGFAADTYVHLLNTSSHSPLQTIGFHTSCSAPIVIGDQLGSVMLTGFVGQDPVTGFQYRLYLRP